MNRTEEVEEMLKRRSSLKFSLRAQVPVKMEEQREINYREATVQNFTFELFFYFFFFFLVVVWWNFHSEKRNPLNTNLILSKVAITER